MNINKAVVARLKKGNNEFEILVDCKKAMEFKEGKDVDFNEVLAADKVYKDIKKGFVVSENDLKNVFGTDDIVEVAKKIIKKGEVQLNKEYRNKLREEKRKQIIEIIHRNAIDTKTGLPHPPQRIENAMEETRVKIDEFKSAEEQIQDILDKLKTVIPIKFEIREILIKVPAQYTGSVYGVVKRYGEILKEEWKSDGSLVLVSKVPSGLTEEYFSELNKLTHGDVETKIIKGD